MRMIAFAAHNPEIIVRCPLVSLVVDVVLAFRNGGGAELALLEVSTLLCLIIAGMMLRNCG
jgi:hypothetical protein